MVICYKWWIQKWEIWIHYITSKSISRNERSQFIVKNTSQWQWQSKAQDCPSKIVACWQILLTDKALLFSSHPIQLVCRVEICHDRRDQRSCKICASCVNFSGKQRNFPHNLPKTTRFLHTKCDFALKPLKFYTLS